MIPNISERTACLISDGLKTCGTSKDGSYDYIWERLYIGEAESVKSFMLWIDKNIHKASEEMPFVENNLNNLYKNHFLKEILC